MCGPRLTIYIEGLHSGPLLMLQALVPIELSPQPDYLILTGTRRGV